MIKVVLQNLLLGWRATRLNKLKPDHENCSLRIERPLKSLSNSCHVEISASKNNYVFRSASLRHRESQATFIWERLCSIHHLTRPNRRKHSYYCRQRVKNFEIFNLFGRILKAIFSIILLTISEDWLLAGRENAQRKIERQWTRNAIMSSVRWTLILGCRILAVS